MLSVTELQAQNGSQELFRIDQAGLKLDDLRIYETRKAAVGINSSLFYDQSVTSGARIQFSDFNGNRMEYEVIRRHSFVDGIMSISARSVNDPADVLSLSYIDGRVRGIVSNVSSNTSFELNYNANLGINTIAEVMPELQDILECGLTPEVHGILHNDAHPVTGSPNAAAGTASARSGYLPSAPHHHGLAEIYDDEVTLDMLIVYTNNAATWSSQNGAGILLDIANGVSFNQIPLDNSGTGILMRVVHVMSTNYDESAAGVTSNLTLRRLAARPGGIFSDDAGFFEDVHAKRDELGADFVHIIPRVDDTGGLGYLPNLPSGRPELAFALTRIQQLANSYTFVHELGHNLGNQHSRNQTAATASNMGGIFEYSTGWAWNNAGGSRTVTVMTYTEGGTRLPFFSSPEVFVDGFPTGSYSGAFAPADNVRSMKEMKHTAANYRLTAFEPPVPVYPGNESITVQTGLGGTQTVNLSLGNTGISNLFWQLDFSKSSMGKALASKNSGYNVTFDDEVSAFEFAGMSDNQDVYKVAGEDGIIYQTTFSAGEGFNLGTSSMAQNWRSIFLISNIQFSVSNENPSVGTQHIRFGKQQDFNTNVGLSVQSPFLGIRPFSRMEASLDVRPVHDNSSADYRVFFMDDRNNAIVAEVIFENRGFIFIRVRNQLNAEVYEFAGNFTFGNYHNVKVVIDPDTNVLSYFVDGEFKRSTTPLAGNSISHIRVSHNNSMTTGYVDVDNVQVWVPHTGFSWFSAARYAGNVQPGGLGDISLTFGGPDIEPGTYTGNLIIRTNSASQPQMVIPITYTMDTVVSIDRETGLPEGFTLSQNYPNPFNPSTGIRFSLPTDSPTRLEVFSVTGQRVATLVDEFKVAGSHSVQFNASGLSSGVYVYRLTSGSWVQTKKMMLIK